MGRCEACGALVGHTTSCSRNAKSAWPAYTPPTPVAKRERAEPTGNVDGAMESWVKASSHDPHPYKVPPRGRMGCQVCGAGPADPIHSSDAKAQAETACETPVTNTQGIENPRAETAAGFAPHETDSHAPPVGASEDDPMGLLTGITTIALKADLVKAIEADGVPATPLEVRKVLAMTREEAQQALAECKAAEQPPARRGPNPCTFDDLVAHGIAVCKAEGRESSIVRGMPWSFTWRGCPVTHESDDLYIVCYTSRSSGWSNTVRLARGDLMEQDEDGIVVARPLQRHGWKAEFEAIKEAQDASPLLAIAQGRPLPMTGQPDKPDWQRRVLFERDELELRLRNLERWVGAGMTTKAPAFCHLPAVEQMRQMRQLDAMRTYLAVLNERISAWEQA